VSSLPTGKTWTHQVSRPFEATARASSSLAAHCSWFRQRAALVSAIQLSVGSGGQVFSLWPLYPSGTSLYCCHGGFPICESYLEVAWPATNNCIWSRPSLYQSFLARIIQSNWIWVENEYTVPPSHWWSDWATKGLFVWVAAIEKQLYLVG
jgi:hypothetical protein